MRRVTDLAGPAPCSRSSLAGLCPLPTREAAADSLLLPRLGYASCPLLRRSDSDLLLRTRTLSTTQNLIPASYSHRCAPSDSGALVPLLSSFKTQFKNPSGVKHGLPSLAQCREKSRHCQDPLRRARLAVPRACTLKNPFKNPLRPCDAAPSRATPP